MWCPEGYVSLVDISIQFNFDIDSVGPGEGRPAPPEGSPSDTDRGLMDYDEMAGFELWRWATFFELLGRHVRACLPSGAIVKLSRPILMPWGHRYRAFPKEYDKRLKCKDIWFDFIELPGTIKTASNLSKISWARGIEGASLCIAEHHLPVAIHDLTEWLIVQSEKPDQDLAVDRSEEGGLPSRIVSAFRSGRVATKPEAKQFLAPNMKWESWREFWKDAVQLDPDLAKPGPRRRD